MARLCFILMSAVLVMTSIEMSGAQQSKALTYTVIKLLTFKTESENCKNAFKNAGKYKQKHNVSLSFGLVPNCSNCERLSIEEHLIRIHKVVKTFAQPLGAVYGFEIRRSNEAIKKCVGNVQLELLTLQMVTEKQIPTVNAAQHTSASIDELKSKAKAYLASLPENAGKQVKNEVVMDTVSATLIREIFLAAFVLQKNRIQIHDMIVTNNVE